MTNPDPNPARRDAIAATPVPPDQVAAPEADPTQRQRPAGELGGHTVQDWEQPARKPPMRKVPAASQAGEPPDLLKEIERSLLVDPSPAVKPVFLRPAQRAPHGSPVVPSVPSASAVSVSVAPAAISAPAAPAASVSAPAPAPLAVRPPAPIPPPAVPARVVAPLTVPAQPVAQASTLSPVSQVLADAIIVQLRELVDQALADAVINAVKAVAPHMAAPPPDAPGIGANVNARQAVGTHEGTGPQGAT